MSIEERVARVEESTKSSHTRLNKIENKIDSIGEDTSAIRTSIEVLNTKLEDRERKIDNNCKRIADLEAKPARRWDALVSAIIAAVIGTGVGYLFAKFL